MQGGIKYEFFFSLWYDLTGIEPRSLGEHSTHNANRHNKPKQENKTWENLRSVVAYLQDIDIVVSVFEIKLRWSVHFWTNALGKGMNPLFLAAMG